jgi:hypothetical protein
VTHWLRAYRISSSPASETRCSRREALAKRRLSPAVEVLILSPSVRSFVLGAALQVVPRDNGVTMTLTNKIESELRNHLAAHRRGISCPSRRWLHPGPIFDLAHGIYHAREKSKPANVVPPAQPLPTDVDTSVSHPTLQFATQTLFDMMATESHVAGRRFPAFASRLLRPGMAALATTNGCHCSGLPGM